MASVSGLIVIASLFDLQLALDGGHDNLGSILVMNES